MMESKASWALGHPSDHYTPQVTLPTYVYTKRQFAETTIETSNYLSGYKSQIISISSTSRVDIGEDFRERGIVEEGQFGSRLWLENLAIDVKSKRSHSNILKQEQSNHISPFTSNLVIHPPQSIPTHISPLNLTKPHLRILSPSKSQVPSSLPTNPSSPQGLPFQNQTLSWTKCSLNDNRCLGFNFQDQKQNEVEYSCTGHVKKSYLD